MLNREQTVLLAIKFRHYCRVTFLCPFVVLTRDFSNKSHYYESHFIEVKMNIQSTSILISTTRQTIKTVTFCRPTKNCQEHCLLLYQQQYGCSLSNKVKIMTLETHALKNSIIESNVTRYTYNWPDRWYEFATFFICGLTLNSYQINAIVCWHCSLKVVVLSVTCIVSLYKKRNPFSTFHLGFHGSYDDLLEKAINFWGMYVFMGLEVMFLIESKRQQEKKIILSDNLFLISLEQLKTSKWRHYRALLLPYISAILFDFNIPWVTLHVSNYTRLLEVASHKFQKPFFFTFVKLQISCVN